MANDGLPSITQIIEGNTWKPKPLGSDTKTEIVVPYKDPVPVGKAKQIKSERAEQERQAKKEAEAGQFLDLENLAKQKLGSEAAKEIRWLKEQGISPSDIKINVKDRTLSYKLEPVIKREIQPEIELKYGSNGNLEYHMITAGNSRRIVDYRLSGHDFEGSVSDYFNKDRLIPESREIDMKYKSGKWLAYDAVYVYKDNKNLDEFGEPSTLYIRTDDKDFTR